jgi:hypothetical protein
VRAISLSVDIHICQVHGCSIFVGMNSIGTATASCDITVGDVDSPISLNANGSIEVYMLTIEFWRYRGELTEVLGRAFDLWRSNPSWYMHRVLVADCAARQGCCSRGCGCCAKRQIEFKQNNSNRNLGVGHCTLACGCCRKARRFQLFEEERTEIRDWLNHEDPDRYLYYHELELASKWGLESDNYDNPFHLIKGCHDVSDNESTTTEGSWMDTALA